ncbi:MAG: veratrol--corrinoid protein metyltransferase [Peptococcaceae bacterium]|jgi:hypothetical protein|nr:veratrol--corrinoid protein metyltransferase [Peptococcaceae bacterium]
MTEKENFLRLLSGKEPAWVPRCSVIYKDKCQKYPPAFIQMRMSFLSQFRTPTGGRDIWGVPYVATKETGGMSLPEPNNFILDDVTKWRDVIKPPSTEGINWEEMAKKDLANINREENAVVIGVGGFFMEFMGMMGFEEGLVSLSLEKETVLELFDFMADYLQPFIEAIMKYYKPDAFKVTDDTATAKNPFISPQMYREMIKPYHMRVAKMPLEAGLPIMMHDCGRCEDSIEDWFDFGVRGWDPAQVMNDLQGIKKKYAGKLMLCGCWDSSGPPGWAGTSEEVVRAAVRECADTYAPGGDFCFWASVYGEADDEEFTNRASWITDEYNNYVRPFYERQG